MCSAGRRRMKAEYSFAVLVNPGHSRGCVGVGRASVRSEPRGCAGTWKRHWVDQRTAQWPSKFLFIQRPSWRSACPGFRNRLCPWDRRAPARHSQTRNAIAHQACVWVCACVSVGRASVPSEPRTRNRTMVRACSDQHPTKHPASQSSALHACAACRKRLNLANEGASSARPGTGTLNDRWTRTATRTDYAERLLTHHPTLFP